MIQMHTFISQVTIVRSWEISSSFGSIQLHEQSICIQTLVHRLPHSQRERESRFLFKSSCMQRYIHKAAKHKHALVFDRILPHMNSRGKKQGFSARAVLLSARDLISLLCVTVLSTGPGSNWPRVM